MDTVREGGEGAAQGDVFLFIFRDFFSLSLSGCVFVHARVHTIAKIYWQTGKFYYVLKRITL